ncbi:MAG: cellulase family glycosylhydrolase [Bacteroidales bacterium]|nr:cellulase family glycosylhydrolase [Bacteroidales bacterium]
MRRLFLYVFMAFAVVSCGDDSPYKAGPEIGAKAPKDLSLSASALNVNPYGGSYDITVTAPAQPKAGSVPSWITVTEGTYKNYRTTFTLTVAVNEAQTERSAQVEFSCKGASAQKLSVVQEGKVVVEEAVMPSSGARAVSEALGLGWNMGNHFDAYYNYNGAGSNYNYPSETVWGNAAATPATFQGVRKAGFKSVRIPVTWLNTIGPAPDYKIEETWLNRVYEVVQYAHDAGLFVIINTHHDENHGDDHWLDIKNAANDSALNTQIKAKITGFWTNLANKFKDCGDWLIMEGFNELNDGGWGWSAEFRANPSKQCGILNEWNQAFVSAVRATGGNNATRWLGVPTYAANPDFEQYVTMPTDPAGKTMLSVHFYNPSDYTIGDKQYQQFGHTGASGKKDGYQEADIKKCFNNLYTKYVAKDIPVYVGEFGCSLRNKGDNIGWAFYLYYLEYVVKAARDYGLSCLLWDNGAEGYGKEHHAYINHGTGEIIGDAAEPIAAMTKARYTDDAAYTLDSVYNSAPKF